MTKSIKALNNTIFAEIKLYEYTYLDDVYFTPVVHLARFIQFIGQSKGFSIYYAAQNYTHPKFKFFVDEFNLNNRQCDHLNDFGHN